MLKACCASASSSQIDLNRKHDINDRDCAEIRRKVMYYIIFMKKKKGGQAPYAIEEVLNFYKNKFYHDDFIISLPGYMSRTPFSISNFKDRFPFDKNYYYTEGMNGKQFVNRSCGSDTIQEAYNYNHSGFTPFFPFRSEGADHSKMLFFLENCCGNNICVSCLDKHPRVKALLIGSSNQSERTYFLGPADKGEADLFIIDSSMVDEDVEAELKAWYEQLSITNKYDDQNQSPASNIIITKQLFGANPNLLNEIFSAVFTNPDAMQYD